MKTITTTITTGVDLETSTSVHDIHIEADASLTQETVYLAVYGAGGTLQHQLREECPALFEGAPEPALDALSLRVLSAVDDWSDEEFALAFGFEREDVEDADAGNGRRGITFTRDQVEKWVGHSLDDEQIEQLEEALPNSSLPACFEAVAHEGLAFPDILSENLEQGSAQ